MIGLGETKGTVVRHYVGATDNGSPYVAVVIRPRGEEETITARVYLTTKALRMAERQLAQCGFDIHGQEIQDLEDSPELLAGREVNVNIYESEYQGRTSVKCDIVIPRVTIDRAKLSELTEKMRQAAEPGEGSKDKPKPKPKPLGPAVSDIPPAKAAELDAQASEEDIPF